ncbi:hypothetical protein J2789_004501 [Variovorax paradoxus]|uniref:hypothetical protein n=1 Tax=Variovorax atrisoli TaxID=3394203 RepID=UPI00119A8E9F|nr:hypothetical protein [Variovorax paradoxus]MDR6521811.1 hypothetical protein [Variovorax paradoxus]
MTHGRPPRRPRRMAVNLVNIAAARATLLTQAERNQVLDPLRGAVAALRRGVATEIEWQLACTAVNIGDAIEKQGVVRGLAEHLHSIDLALFEIGKRARAGGEWRSPALYYEERDLMDLLVDLHSHQVKSLSYGEFIRARDKAVAQTSSTPGGRVVEFEPQQGVLA